MIFNTWEFGAFALVTLAAYWLFVPVLRRPLFLIGAGCVFYFASVPAYLSLILALAAITFLCAKRIEQCGPRTKGARTAMILAVAAAVGVLAVFKYAKLFAATLALVCHGGCIHSLPDIIVPLAISFFTFEFVHFIVDVYLGKIRDVRLRDFALFAMFFPTLVAGPIKRYQNFVPQIGRVRHLDGVLAAAGVYRIICGLAKKMIVADSMTPLVRPISMGDVTLYGSADLWIAVLAYTIKIYFDFSGYSDIAIGMANLLGFQILENFDRPYRASDISLFWRRWHISLSSWIRDYLFIPLGGSRVPFSRGIANLAIVMAVAGLWHGAAWHFVLWGLWHGAGLAVHRIWSVRMTPVFRLPTYLGTPLTFVFVALGWVLFAAPTTESAAHTYLGLFGIF